MSKSKKVKKHTVGEPSPQEYKKLLSKTELIEISLINCKSNLSWAKMIPEPTDLGSPQLTIEDNYKYKSQKDLYIISAEWVLSVKFEKDTENFLEINALYNVVLSKSEELSKVFWNIYKKATLPLIVYPYFREFVQNITSRMNIPPLTLPILYR